MRFHIRRFIPYMIVVILCLNLILYNTDTLWNHEEPRKRFAAAAKSFNEINNNKYVPQEGRKDIVTTINNRAYKEHSYNESTMVKMTSSECNDVTFPASLLRRDFWAPVNKPTTLYVFSGYVNVRQRGTVSIVGAVALSKERYYCQLWYLDKVTGKRSMNVVDAKVNRYHSNGNKYVGGEVTCKLNDSRVPDSVSVVTSPCGTPKHVVSLTGPSTLPYRYNFTMCIKPLNIRYGRAYELIEWIELNRILGAEKFIFYRYDTRSNVDRVLEEYTKRGIVEVINWDLPMRVHTWPPSSTRPEIKSFGQASQTNDCHLRLKHVSKYLIPIDMDEFLIPHREGTSTWAELLDRLPVSGVYMFRNSFFRKEWNSTNQFERKDLAVKYTMITLLKTLRETKIWTQKERSKYIARTDSVQNLEIHDVTRYEGPTSLHVVNPSDGLLHHYRNWLKYNDSVSRVEDRTVEIKYKDELIDRVLSVWSNLSGVELDIPI